MRLLLIAPPYMGLHLPIVAELQRQGHEVTFVEDQMFEYDWKYPYRSVYDRMLRRLNCSLRSPFRQYWKKKFEEMEELHRPYDGLIVVNGCSLCDYFFKKVKESSPDMKKTLYLWDNSSFFDYYFYRKRFDKVMTYDLDDSEKYHVGLLPFYWIDSNCTSPIKYQVSMIGSNHDDRLSIARRVAQQLKDANISYYIKVLDASLPEDDIVIHKPIAVESVQEIIAESACVLDTDRESQTGTTPRLIWALANGKKVITTNRNITRMPFYSSQQIQILNRTNPDVDLRFLQYDNSAPIRSSYIEDLRIDKWVGKLLL